MDGAGWKTHRQRTGNAQALGEWVSVRQVAGGSVVAGRGRRVGDLRRGLLRLLRLIKTNRLIASPRSGDR